MKRSDLDVLRKKAYCAIGKQGSVELLTLLSESPALVNETFQGVGWLHHACHCGNTELAMHLLSQGFDVNRKSGKYNETPLDSAVWSGKIDLVKLLLERDANPNAERELILACAKGNLEIVKLLVEHGADIHRVFGEKKEPRINAMSQAIDYGHTEIADYLASLGATEPEQTGIEGEKQSWRKAIVAAMERTYGKVLPVALTQIAPGRLPLSVHVIPPTPNRPTNILFTTGMSAKPMKVPRGQDKYQYAEICVELPADWPVRGPQSQEAKFAWPAKWLLQIATHPHANRTWLGGPVTIIANGEPPEPLFPNTKLSCLLLTGEVLEVDSKTKTQPRQIILYKMLPIYTEERDLEIQKGINALGEAFDRCRVGQVVDIHRQNVAI